MGGFLLVGDHLHHCHWRLVTQTADALTADLDANGIRKVDSQQADVPAQQQPPNQEVQAPLLVAAALPGVHLP